MRERPGLLCGQIEQPEVLGDLIRFSWRHLVLHEYEAFSVGQKPDTLAVPLQLDLGQPDSGSVGTHSKERSVSGHVRSGVGDDASIGRPHRIRGQSGSKANHRATVHWDLEEPRASSVA